MTTPDDARPPFPLGRNGKLAMDITDGIVPPMMEFVEKSIAKATAELRSRLDILEAENREMKERLAKSLCWDGTYNRAKAYEKSTSVTHQGSLFTAINDVPPRDSPPSDNSPLTIRRGAG